MSPQETIDYFCFAFVHVVSVVFQCIDVENLNPLPLSVAARRFEVGMRSEGKTKKSRHFG